MTNVPEVDIETLGGTHPLTARHHRNRRTPMWVWRILGLAAFLALWQAAVSFGWVYPVFVASPFGVFKTLWHMVATGFLWPHLLETLQATFIGFFAGVVVGALLGFIIGLSPFLSGFTSPFITMLNAVPRIALAPLFVLWVGIDIRSRILLVFSLVVFIVLTNTISGTQNVEPDHLRLARLFNARRTQMVFKVALPSVTPWILAAMRLSFAYALSGAIVGEMFLGQQGLGYLIVAGSGVFNIAQVFAALTVAVAVAFLCDLLMARAERWVLRWRA